MGQFHIPKDPINNTLKEIADYLGIHYNTVSKAIAKAEANKNDISRPTPNRIPDRTRRRTKVSR